MARNLVFFSVDFLCENYTKTHLHAFIPHNIIPGALPQTLKKKREKEMEGKGNGEGRKGKDYGTAFLFLLFQEIIPV
jgi:hypothetical protein